LVCACAITGASAARNPIVSAKPRFTLNSSGHSAERVIP
jgi:hypothetical protein